MANIGLDPSVLVAPDYQTQMLQAQRRLALSSALQQQAITDTPGNGGSISWTQGLARVLDGLFAGQIARKGYQQMQGANQGYAAGLRGMFGMPAPQTAQEASPPQTGTPPPPPQASQPQPPKPDPNGLPAMTPQMTAIAQGQPAAPPQAASPPPSAPPPAPTGGAPYPMSLTGDPRKDFMLYMENPEEFSKAQIANAAKGGAPTDTEVLMSHAQQAATQGNYALAAQLKAQADKAGYIPPTSGRPGGWTTYPDGHKEFNPQAPAPGAMPVLDAQGKPTGAWTLDPSAATVQAQQAGAVAGAQAGAKAPYDVIPSFQNGQPGYQSKANITGGVLNGRYYGGGQGLPSGPPIGKEAAYNTYGKQSADAFMETQGISKESPQRVQALREMQTLIAGPNALTTGPTASKMQQLAEEHGLPFGYSSNAFVFNKDAARFVAQSASDLGLNGSDARLGMMAHASPNMTMTPQALHVVIPTMIGLEYAKMAKATAAASWAQSRGPDTNAQFESTWRQSYDPRMFTAYAQGGPQALAQAPANVRQQWLKDYRALKSMGVDFTQFAQ